MSDPYQEFNSITRSEIAEYMNDEGGDFDADDDRLTDEICDKISSRMHELQFGVPPFVADQSKIQELKNWVNGIFEEMGIDPYSL